MKRKRIDIDGNRSGFSLWSTLSINPQHCIGSLLLTCVIVTCVCHSSENHCIVFSTFCQRFSKVTENISTISNRWRVREDRDQHDWAARHSCVVDNRRTLLVCTRVGRGLGLCPNLFSSDQWIDSDLFRQGISSNDEQVDSLVWLERRCWTKQGSRSVWIVWSFCVKMAKQLNLLVNSSWTLLNIFSKWISTMDQHHSAIIRSLCWRRFRLLSFIIRCHRNLLAFHSNERQLVICCTPESQASGTRSDQFNWTISSSSFSSLVSSVDSFLSKTYLRWLINWCCSHLYLEGSYSQRHLSILTLHWLIHLHGHETVQTACRQCTDSFSLSPCLRLLSHVTNVFVSFLQININCTTSINWFDANHWNIYFTVSGTPTKTFVNMLWRSSSDLT